MNATRYRWWLVVGLAVAVGLGAFQPRDAHAQEEPPPEGVEWPVVRGTVVDLQSEAPVPNAMVKFAGSDRVTMTDSLGHFTLQSPPAWEHRLAVMVLGYQPTEFVISEEEMARSLVIAIRPDPILLEGLRVMVDRFTRRRRSFPGSVQMIDQAALTRGSGGTAYDAVRSRIASLHPCPNDSWDVCVLRRGRRQRANVCIDEVPAFRSLADLAAYLPEDLYLVEIYDRGAEVRIYTNWFVERAMTERRSLRPLFYGC